MPTSSYLQSLFAILVAATIAACGVGEADDDAGQDLAAPPAELQDPLCVADTAKIFASDPGEFNDFGEAVAIDGDTAIVTATGHRAHGFVVDPAVLRNGSAYIFTRAGASWVQAAELQPDDALGFTDFGASVALSGDTAAVGAPRGGDSDFNNPGAVYIYKRRIADGSWVKEAKLLPSDDNGGDRFGGALFGASVDLSGKTLLVGAIHDDDERTNAGAAYVFERRGGAWTETAKLLSGDVGHAHLFGISVAISADTAVVGARSGGPRRGPSTGAAYVYERRGGAWVRASKLVPADAERGDDVGSSVDVSGSTIVVGARGKDGGLVGQASGAVYVFERAAGAWTEQAKLPVIDAGFFGRSVAIKGDVIAASAGLVDVVTGEEAGSVYVLRRSAGVWALELKLDSSDSTDILFGHDVDISGDRLIVGNPNDDALGPQAGAVDIYTLTSSGGPCPFGGQR